MWDGGGGTLNACVQRRGGVECLRRLILSLAQVWTGPELRSVDPTCELPGLECVSEDVRRVFVCFFV